MRSLQVVRLHCTFPHVLALDTDVCLRGIAGIGDEEVFRVVGRPGPAVLDVEIGPAGARVAVAARRAARRALQAAPGGVAGALALLKNPLARRLSGVPPGCNDEAGGLALRLHDDASYRLVPAGRLRMGCRHCACVRMPCGIA